MTTLNELKEQGDYIKRVGGILNWLVNETASSRPDDHLLFMARIICEITPEEDLKSIGITFKRHQVTQRFAKSWLLQDEVCDEIIAEMILSNHYVSFLTNPSHRKYIFQELESTRELVEEDRRARTELELPKIDDIEDEGLYEEEEDYDPLDEDEDEDENGQESGEENDQGFSNSSGLEDDEEDDSEDMDE